MKISVINHLVVPLFIFSTVYEIKNFLSCIFKTHKNVNNLNFFFTSQLWMTNIYLNIFNLINSWWKYLFYFSLNIFFILFLWLNFLLCIFFLIMLFNAYCMNKMLKRFFFECAYSYIHNSLASLWLFLKFILFNIYFFQYHPLFVFVKKNEKNPQKRH